MKSTLRTLAASILFGFAGLAANATTFTVDEGSVPGTPANLVTATGISGSYTEILTFTGINFETVAFGKLASFAGTTDPSFLVSSPSPFPTGYSMYVKFHSTGILTQFAPPAFEGTSGDIEIWIDPSSNTANTFGANAQAGFNLTGTGDDYLIATSTSQAQAKGTVDAQGDGFFDIWFKEFTLTNAGKQYFIDPNPFYLNANFDGDFNTFVPAGTVLVNGDASIQFGVPEPESLALVGLSLVGLAVASRRRKNV